MKLSDLQYAVESDLRAPSILYRIQRQRSRPGTVAVGPLRVAPSGLLRARFDLPHLEVGYFAESGETAVYESLARRDDSFLAMSVLAGRALLTVSTVQTLPLLDLRPHAGAWPVLQSERYESTQELALEAHELHYQGLVYRSAQQYGADCYVLFGEALKALRLVSKQLLVHPRTGALHQAAAAAVLGSQVPLAP
jgi:hypothetical protein